MRGMPEPSCSTVEGHYHLQIIEYSHELFVAGNGKTMTQPDAFVLFFDYIPRIHIFKKTNTGRQSMKYMINEKDNCVVIEMKGKIMGGPDAETFLDDLKKLIDQDKKNIIIDLDKVNFMNSSGIGIIIGGYKTMKASGGDIKLCNVNKHLNSLLMVSHLNTVFDMHDSLDSAAKAYQN